MSNDFFNHWWGESPKNFTHDNVTHDIIDESPVVFENRKSPTLRKYE